MVIKWARLPVGGSQGWVVSLPCVFSWERPLGAVLAYGIMYLYFGYVFDFRAVLEGFVAMIFAKTFKKL